VLGFAMGPGFVIGPVSGGAIAHDVSVSTAFAAAAVVTLCGVLFNILALGETVDSSHSQDISCGSVASASLHKFRRLQSLIANSPRPLLFLVLFCYSMAQGAFTIVLVYTDRELGWSPLLNGLFLSYLGLLVVVCQVVGNRLVLPRIGERKMMVFAIVCATASFFLFGVDGAAWIMFLGVTVGSPAYLFESTLKGSISKIVPGQDQGQLQGGLEAVDGMGRVFGPVMAALVYGHFQSNDNGKAHSDAGERVFWFVAAGWALLAMLILGYAANPFNSSSTHDAEEIAESLKRMDDEKLKKEREACAWPLPLEGGKVHGNVGGTHEQETPAKAIKANQTDNSDAFGQEEKQTAIEEQV